MAALVALPCCLPGDTESDGNLGPADTEADCAVDDGVQLCLCRVSRRSGASELLQDLSPGRLGVRLRRARGVHRPL
jgi:hypothetical protein